jgi:hypothetical protein
MYVPLVVCPACSRHVRHIESACPFCQGELGDDVGSRMVPDTNRRLTRAAAFVFASSVAVSACGGSTTVEDDGASSSASSTTGSSSSTDASGSGSGVALYGAPAVGGGGAGGIGGAGGAGGDPAGAGGAQADYGAPPPP